MRADAAQYLPAQSHISHFVLAPQTHQLFPALCLLHGFWSGRKRISKWNPKKTAVLCQEKPNNWTKPPSTVQGQGNGSQGPGCCFSSFKIQPQASTWWRSPSLPVFCVTTPNLLLLSLLSISKAELAHPVSMHTFPGPPALPQHVNHPSNSAFQLLVRMPEPMKDFVPWEKCLVCKRCSKSICSEASSSSVSTLTHCCLLCAH